MTRGFYKVVYVGVDGKKHSKTFECQLDKDGFFDNNEAFKRASDWVETKEYTESKISFHTVRED